jgi:hypothetical protein
MATVTTITYSANATALTFTTLSSLAASQTVGAGSLAVDNYTTSKYVDVMVMMKIIYSAAIPFGTVFAGVGVSTDFTNFGNPYVGTDSTVTLLLPPRFPTNFTPGPGGSLYYPTSQIFYAESMDFSGLATTPTVFLSIPSIASCIGSPNVMPQKWGMFALNMTNAAFAAACTATYSGITYTNT